MSSDTRVKQPKWRAVVEAGRVRDTPARAERRRIAASAELSPVWELSSAHPVSSGAALGVRRDTVLRRTLGLTDVCAALIALGLAVALIPGQRPVNLRLTDVLVIPLVLIAAKALGLYDRDQHVLRKTTLDETPSIIHLSVLFALTTWLAEALLLSGYLARPQVFALVLFSFGFIVAGRVCARAVVSRMLAPERCLIVGDGVEATRITNKLATSSGLNAIVVGRIALHPDDRNHVDSVLRADGSLGNPDQLARLIDSNEVERVIVASDTHDQEEILQLIRLIKVLGVKVAVLPRLLEVVGSSATFEDVDGLSLLGVHQSAATTSSATLKRLMDVVGAGAGALALAPLLLMITAMVKLDSRGPVFFRQRRIGRHGETFFMLKFRSMVPNAEDIKAGLREHNEAEGGLFKITNDPRITRVGRFLRRTSLDELPQLLNVVGGSMSLVGPRPLVPDEDALIEGWQRRRLAVKPGMTGMWQIFGSSRIPMQEMVKIDYLYGANWSLWLDLKILLKTIPYVLRRRGL